MTSDNRYTIARQTYTATHDIHGELRDIEPAHIRVELEGDKQRAAERIVDLAMADPGVIFILMDSQHALGQVAVFAQRGETRDELIADTVGAMTRFEEIEELTEPAAAV